MTRLLVAGLLAAFAAPALAQTPQAAPPPACQEAERGQFDFWVGDWDVYPTGADKLVAHSTIEKLYGGCAVRENWKPLKGTGGGSLNARLSGPTPAGPGLSSRAAGTVRPWC